MIHALFHASKEGALQKFNLKALIIRGTDFDVLPMIPLHLPQLQVISLKDMEQINTYRPELMNEFLEDFMTALACYPMVVFGKGLVQKRVEQITKARPTGIAVGSDSWWDYENLPSTVTIIKPYWLRHFEYIRKLIGIDYHTAEHKIKRARVETIHMAL